MAEVIEIYTGRWICRQDDKCISGLEILNSFFGFKDWQWAV